MIKPIISVVIPVYNAECYLKASVESVLRQKNGNFELILVNDGSTDKSGSICDRYRERDVRVQVIHKTNEGAGAARNDGIRAAKGDYVVFVDSDDYIEPDYLELLSLHDEDLVFIDVDRVNSTGQVVGTEYMSKYKGLPKDEILRCQMTGRLPWGGVRKCVKRSLLTKNEIVFSNHKIGEEAIYSYLILRYAETIGYIEKPVYHYLQHGDSLSNSIVDDPWGEVAIALKEIVKEKGSYHEFGDTVNAFIETAAIVSAYKMATRYSLIDFMQKAEIRWSLMLSQIDSCMSIDRGHQSKSIRYYGLLCRCRQWPIAWLVGRLRR